MPPRQVASRHETKLSGADIRTRFLRFFEERGHRTVSSGPLVPRLDPTLLFTNAGMNQFKGVFLGEEKRDYVRAASAQKCVRAGGKHNDLENVGRTARHLTFFEMLGNFSFGDYFKREAVRYALEFVTKDLRIPKDRLHASVFRDDDEAAEIWRSEAGLDEDRIHRFGEKDNFWSMGDTGPCGPCSELFFDQGPETGCKEPSCRVGCECDRFVEFWNLVFMEFEQRPDGTRVKLPKPSIDTGMGLERLAAIVQGVTSNYETDLFAPILAGLGKLVGATYEASGEAVRVSMRVIADHVRAMTFLICDGVNPSNEGRGYVLRRLMRRAMRHGRKLGLTKPFLLDLSPSVVDVMGGFYPELRRASASTVRTIEAEEARFSETIDRGLELLEEEIANAKGSGVFPGDTAFTLYETYGFPADLTADVVREHGMAWDQEGFDEAFERHREKARGSWKGSGERVLERLVPAWVSRNLCSEFVGYGALEAQGIIKVFVEGGEEVVSAASGVEVEMISDRTPFYGEAGGQVGDIGTVSGEGFALEVVDTKRPAQGIIVHKCRVMEGVVKTGDRADFKVDGKARADTARNHTATHMLHAALKEVLGDHVRQAGSLVGPERLRFDFTHTGAVLQGEIEAIERIVNERIWADAAVEMCVLPLDEAVASGATALFDEKYGDDVRVVSLGGYSKELCGGTHAERTGQVGVFKVVRESSVAAGIRRIEAFTGPRALRHLQQAEALLREIAVALGTAPEKAMDGVARVLARQKEIEKEIRKLQAGPGAGGSLPVVEIGGVSVVSGEVGVGDHRVLRERADREMERIRSGIVALGAKGEGKAFVVIKVSRDLTGRFDASALIRPIAEILGGNGGGRADMAQAGGPAHHRLSESLKLLGDTILINS